ncbi:LOW QUALITY PROTEIN: malonyl CoA-acyl carrier protein transacylase [Geomicrobium sp. JCM 19039]|nr:LOW QUALITY PROTEIN: malonyl CoA-acyl carrier protein transacylase [Geomicrobium sp. JCM 19039]
MENIAYLFPGQGSQALGMGHAAANDSDGAKAILNRADDRLPFSLSELMKDGPEEQLKETANAQPALLTASIASLSLLEDAEIELVTWLGIVLGSIVRLLQAGALRFDDAVYAVHERGKFMQAAVPAGEGTMAAVIGMEREPLMQITKRVSESGHAVQLANLNAPGQIVISGTVEGVQAASAAAKEEGARRVMPLNVSGPFHSALMEPAKEQLRNVLTAIEFQNARIPVVTNIHATPVSNGEELRQGLVEQLTSPVYWEDTIRFMIREGVDTFVEFGSGQVLSGSKRFNAEMMFSPSATSKKLNNLNKQ